MLTLIERHLSRLVELAEDQRAFRLLADARSEARRSARIAEREFVKADSFLPIRKPAPR
jgi:hypothetical protein